jgi:hypothetical protein
VATAQRMLLRKMDQEPETMKTMQDVYSYLSDFRVAVPDTCELIQIGLTLPPTSASAERSFSSMKLIKTCLRSTMLQNRFNNLAVIGIHQYRAKSLNLNRVVTRFAQSTRRIQLC